MYPKLRKFTARGGAGNGPVLLLGLILVIPLKLQNLAAWHDGWMRCWSITCGCGTIFVAFVSLLLMPWEPCLFQPFEVITIGNLFRTEQWDHLSHDITLVHVNCYQRLNLFTIWFGTQVLQAPRRELRKYCELLGIALLDDCLLYFALIEGTLNVRSLQCSKMFSQKQ